MLGDYSAKWVGYGWTQPTPPLTLSLTHTQARVRGAFWTTLKRKKKGRKNFKKPLPILESLYNTSLQYQVSGYVKGAKTAREGHSFRTSPFSRAEAFICAASSASSSLVAASAARLWSLMAFFLCFSCSRACA